MAGWRKGRTYLLLRCDWHNCKGLVSFSYSFLVDFTCPLRNKLCRDVQDCDFNIWRYFLQTNHLELENSSVHQFGAEHRFSILSKLFIHPRGQWAWDWWVLNIRSSHLLYVLHLISKSCSIEYWPLFAHSVQDRVSWRSLGKDIVRMRGGCCDFGMVWFFISKNLI